MAKKSSKGAAPAVAVQPVGSRSPAMNTARANLQAQVSSGGINQAQADAEYARLSKMPVSQVSAGNQAAQQAMSVPPPVAQPSTMPPPAASPKLTMALMQRPAQNMPNANMGPPPQVDPAVLQNFQNLRQQFMPGKMQSMPMPMPAPGGAMQQPNMQMPNMQQPNMGGFLSGGPGGAPNFAQSSVIQPQMGQQAALNKPFGF